MSNTKKNVSDKIKAEVSFKYKADWLLNDFGDDIWYLKEYLNGQQKSRLTVSWDRDSYGESFHKERWNYWKDFGKKVAYWYMESPKTSCYKVGTLAYYCREIRALSEWLCFERKCINVGVVSKQDIIEYELYLKNLGIAVNTYTIKLAILRSFKLLSKEVGEGLHFDPYIVRGSIKGIAKKFATLNGHTPTIYPRELFKLINFSLDQLKRVDDVIGRLDLYLELKNTHQDIYSAYKSRTGQSSNELYIDCCILYGSAIIIILSLLGERMHELLSRDEASVLEVLDFSAEEIRGREFKTAKHNAGKETVRPVIDEVIQALDVVNKLTKHTRSEYNGSAFFLRLPLKHNTKSSAKQFELVANVMYLMFDKVAKATSFPGKIRPHMFRRSFSMLWAWRYEIGDLYELSKILFHNDEKFTQIYTEDEDVWQFLPEFYQDLTFEIIEQSLLGRRNFIGGFSKALQRYARLLRSKVKVLTPERASSFARMLMERTDITVIPSADGYCFMNTARASWAKCSTGGFGPNYANRSESTCTKCPNFAADETRSDYWQKRYNAHKAVLESTDIELVKNAAIRGMNTSNRYIPTMPFKEVSDEC